MRPCAKQRSDKQILKCTTQQTSASQHTERQNARPKRHNGAQDFIEVGAHIRVFGEHTIHERANAAAIVRGNRRHLLLHNLHDEIVQIEALNRRPELASIFRSTRAFSRSLK
jgi:hypothetical protein